MSLINIGSNVAFNAMVSLSTVALVATYTLSIGCITIKRFGKEPLPPARWSLGRWGIVINCLALAYSVWVLFWSFWPIETNVTSDEFNWASVLFVALFGLALVLYVLRAKRTYVGPVVAVKGVAE